MEHTCQNYQQTCPIVVLGQMYLSITMVLFTSVCFFLQVMRRVAYIYQNKGQFIINAKFLFNLKPHMMFRVKFDLVDFLI